MDEKQPDTEASAANDETEFITNAPQAEAPRQAWSDADQDDDEDEDEEPKRHTWSAVTGQAAALITAGAAVACRPSSPCWAGSCSTKAAQHPPRRRLPPQHRQPPHPRPCRRPSPPRPREHKQRPRQPSPHPKPNWHQRVPATPPTRRNSPTTRRPATKSPASTKGSSSTTGHPFGNGRNHPP